MPRGFFFLNSETVAEHKKSLPSPVRSCKQSRMRYRPKRSRLGDRQAHMQELQEKFSGQSADLSKAAQARACVTR